ncbi:hypothetical protein C9E82_14845 [Paracoccus siganidrum]|uniref:Uncharacterized protein n=2 Tax=Paracoccus siganidrum TaxID=1276757 RepID=A0A419A651_9RHOB|nr:hypothetical protein D3P05_11915 [Paracoccus siganidrum]RMC32176.1 hypothetical protein C9E82_14845 [Paracoccus siganidrum]
MGLHLRDIDGWDNSAALAPAARAVRGRMAQLAGVMAEDAVLARYVSAGYELLARRWRGRAGEIDLILRQGECIIFVEVKQSVSHAAAAERLGRAQMNRICLAACEFCGGQPRGQLTEMRMDVALVDGVGRIEILENAFGGC